MVGQMAAAAPAAAAPADEKGDPLKELKKELASVVREISKCKGDLDALENFLKKENKNPAEVAAQLAPDKAIYGKLLDEKKGSLSLAVPTCGAPSISTVAWWRWCAQCCRPRSTSWRPVVAVVEAALKVDSTFAFLLRTSVWFPVDVRN